MLHAGLLVRKTEVQIPATIDRPPVQRTLEHRARCTMTELEKLVARVMSTAFIEPVTPTAVVKKPKPKGKKHRITRRLDAMSDEQKELLLLLLSEKLATVTVKGETYCYRRSDAGWVIRSLHDGEPEHTVLLDFSACSCPDCRFRGRVCKHMTVLQGVMS